MKKIYKIFIVIILLAVALGVGFYCGINSNLNSANSDKKDNNSGKENNVVVSKRGICILGCKTPLTVFSKTLFF